MIRVNSRIKRRWISAEPTHPPAQKAMKVGTHHWTPMSKVVVKYRFMKEKVQAKTSFSLLGGSPGPPDGVNE